MSNVEKAILTQEQADILSKLLRGFPISELAFDYAEGDFLFIPEELRHIGLHDFMTAIYVGYEVEKSPTEKVREIYANYEDKKYGHCDQFSANDIKQVIKDVLEALEVKVEGVNAF